MHVRARLAGFVQGSPSPQRRMHVIAIRSLTLVGALLMTAACTANDDNPVADSASQAARDSSVLTAPGVGNPTVVGATTGTKTDSTRDTSAVRRP